MIKFCIRRKQLNFPYLSILECQEKAEQNVLLTCEAQFAPTQLQLKMPQISANCKQSLIRRTARIKTERLHPPNEIDAKLSQAICVNITNITCYS